MFEILPFLVISIFVVAGVIVAIALICTLGQWRKNNQAPVLTVQAFVSGKRTEDSSFMMMSGDVPMWIEDTTHYAAFQVPSGDCLEFHISGSEYAQFREGDRGDLTFQGKRYLGFRRRM
ncbi:MAG: DUF2500 domain-containing protein [Oscillospiraceae bacterium]|nr:DUF2500 domain-containing protein [Oscillospiraceae bacterium]